MIDYVDEEELERFWEKVDIKSSDECWEWQAYRNKKGYGCFRLGGVEQAHRVAYVITNGQISDGKPQINHSCDNRSCCNPAHLWAGTQLENMRDAKAKGRNAKGKDITARLFGKMKPGNTSGHVGISQRKDNMKWVARYQISGKAKYLGEYSTKEEAIAVYNKAVKSLVLI